MKRIRDSCKVLGLHTVSKEVWAVADCDSPELYHFRMEK